MWRIALRGHHFVACSSLNVASELVVGVILSEWMRLSPATTYIFLLSFVKIRVIALPAKKSFFAAPALIIFLRFNTADCSFISATSTFASQKTVDDCVIPEAAGGFFSANDLLNKAAFDDVCVGFFRHNLAAK